MSYDNWKTESPHEGATCPDCGAFLQVDYSDGAPPSLVCRDCEEEREMDPRRSFWGTPSRTLFREENAMKFEMTIRENLMLMACVRRYREDLVRNQRSNRANPATKTDLYWAERNRVARKLYRKLSAA